MGRASSTGGGREAETPGAMKARRADPLKRAMAACRRVWAGVGLFSACLNGLMLAVPLYMMQIYDRVLATGSVDTLLALTVMVAAALVVLGLLDAVRGRVLARAGAWLDRELGRPVLAGAVAAAQHAGGGVSAQGLRDLATVRGYVGGPGVLPLFDVPWAPVFLAIVFLIHPLLGWIGLGGALALFGCAVLNDLSTRKKLMEANGAAARALNAADSAVRNADAIAAMGMLPALARRWREAGARGRHLQIAASDASGSISAAAKTLRFALQVAMLGVGAYLVLHHEMSAGGMIASAIILARGLAPAEQLINAWRALVGARTAWRRLRELVEHVPERDGGTALPRPAGRIGVEQVSYAPPGLHEPLIRQASFRLEPGEALGIVGPSGAGKTTLVRLLVGSLVPTAGHLRLDGADLHAWPDADRGRYVGYLPQNVELFAGSVRDNVARLGEAEDEAVVAAAQRAGAHETILALPEGYGTRIGEGGVPISGGQRQRIALARAVYGEPALVVLDEPNAHLDAEGEQALVESVVRMRERGVTVVLIAQRAGVMAQMDKILVLRAGEVAAFGPREEVLAALRRPTLLSGPDGRRVPATASQGPRPA